MRIIAATQNKGKLAEFYTLVSKFDMEIISLNDAGYGNIDIDENGSSCEENSKIKAETICRISGEPVIADDSGLFVDALGGEPGVNSARYAGVHGDDAANRKKLLDKLGNTPWEARTAHFVTVITLMYPDGKVLQARGECHGHISFEERGERGFGYDSVFVPLESDKTFAELSMEFKNSISHRARALQRLSELL